MRRCFIVVSLMVALGYFVHPVKSVLVPSGVIRWLGLDVNLLAGEFSVPTDKRVAITALLRAVLAEGLVGYKTLERVVGKLGSLSLAVPGILIKLRQMYASLTSAGRSGTWWIPVEALLREEMEACLAMPFWEVSVAPWKSPAHLTIILEEPTDITPAAGDLTLTGVVRSARVTFWHPSGKGCFEVSVPRGEWANAGMGPASGLSLPCVGDTVLTVLQEALSRSKAEDCFVTLAVHGTWRPSRVFASDLSGNQGGAERADRLFSMVSAARVLLKVLSVPGTSGREAYAAERLHFRLAPGLWEGEVQPRFWAAAL